MGKAEKKSKSLLDIFVRTRTVKALDKAVSKSKAYQTTLKRQDKAFDRLEKAGLSKEQAQSLRTGRRILPCNPADPVSLRAA